MNSVAEFIRPDIRALSVYAVADVPADFVKLDAMELPYHFPAPIQQELAQRLAQVAVNLYPHTASSGLQQSLRRVFSIPEAAEVVLGNGSDELIQLLTMLVAKPEAVMLGLDPGFVMYRHNAAVYGMRYIGVPLNDDFSMNLPAVLAAIREHRPALVFLAYPNNPTGVMFSRDQVQAVIDAAPGLVVVDEAYGAFASDSFLPSAGSTEKLVVMRTLSKIGFAGLRIGYACGHPAVMGELAKIVPPYNMNRLSLSAADFAMQHYDWIAEHIELLKNERSRLLAELSALPGCTAFPGQTNFVTVRLPDAEAAFAALYEAKILVKKLHGSHPLLHNCLRLTIGTPQQNDQVLAVLRRLTA